MFYKVLRERGRTDVHCHSANGVTNCFYSGLLRATTRRTEAVGHPGPGTYTYRIAVAANWLDDPKMGDVFLVSAPVTVSVP